MVGEVDIESLFTTYCIKSGPENLKDRSQIFVKLFKVLLLVLSRILFVFTSSTTSEMNDCFATMGSSDEISR